MTMMATGYSTLFSLGLSSIHTSIPPFSAGDVVSPQTAPISATPSTPGSAVSPWTSCAIAASYPPAIQVDTQKRPPMGRRRSSVTAANSPLGGMHVKSPSIAASTSFARALLRTPPKSKGKHRRSDSDATPRSMLGRSNSVGEVIKVRRVVSRKPAAAPPDKPLPDLPKASERSPVRPPSDVPSLGRILADKEGSLNAAGRLSLAVPSVSGGASASSPQTLLTPGFATKLVLALSTPPSSASASALGSPIDPMLSCRSYFESAAPLEDAMKEN